MYNLIVIKERNARYACEAKSTKKIVGFSKE